MSQAIARMLQTVPEPPCTAHRCTHKQRCGTEGLACQAFAAYVHEGRVSDPAMQLRKDRWGRLLGAAGDMAKPTRAIYLRLYSHDDLSLRDFVGSSTPKDDDDGHCRATA